MRAPRLKPLLLLSSTLAFGGCATLTPWTADQGERPPLQTATVKQQLVPVPNYTGAPCWMQREWAKHNSRVASLKGKPQPIKAPCDVDPPKPPVPGAKAEPKTS